MPTYYSTGVTATLSVCDLKPTLSPTFQSLKQGPELREEASRLQKVLSTTEALTERPVGGDGSATGIMRFLGQHEDMPFYMVEVQKRKDDRDSSDTESQTQRTPQTIDMVTAHQASNSDDSSPLTSLSGTPTPTRQNSSAPPVQSKQSAQTSAEAITSLANDVSLEDRVQVWRTLLGAPKVQALVLDLQLSDKSFLPVETVSARGENRTINKDLKIEVFVNGQFADMACANGDERRRKVAHIVDNKARFSGTRIHRQIEKPWIYSIEHPNPEATTRSDDDTDFRWSTISAAYLAEAELRGRNRHGDLSSSGEFLRALALLDIPERLKNCQRFGIVDIIITVGKGRKYRPDTLYLSRPTRMNDSNYRVRKTVHKEVRMQSDNSSVEVDEPEREEVEGEAFIIQRSSPAKTDSPKKVVDFAKELNLNVDPAKTIVGGYTTSRGTKPKEGRTLTQRLGDLKKMNCKNQEKQLAKIKDEFGAEEPSPKKQRMDSGVALHVFDPTGSVESAMDVDREKRLSKSSGLPEGADPGALLTQDRIDLALNEGAASTGALLRRIASMSPQRTPRKKTKAAALAHSPTNTPVKSPQRKKADTARPGDKVVAVDGSPLPKRPAEAGRRDTSTTSWADGTASTAQKPMSSEQSVRVALSGFEIPESCLGSCVGYIKDEAIARQTTKVRGGEFKEESILVGMRFLIL